MYRKMQESRLTEAVSLIYSLGSVSYFSLSGVLLRAHCWGRLHWWMANTLFTEMTGNVFLSTSNSWIRVEVTRLGGTVSVRYQSCSTCFCSGSPPPHPGQFSRPLGSSHFLQEKYHQSTMACIQYSFSGLCQPEIFPSPGSLGYV